jgi:putative salt-induced outer membrane protein YdiY
MSVVVSLVVGVSAVGATPAVDTEPVHRAALASAGGAAISLQDAAAAPPPPAPADPVDFWHGWKRTADLGLNGSEGNSENASLRAGIGAERKASDMETKAGINYQYATSDGTKTKSRGEAFARNDWLFADSPWGFFAQGKVEYDEFQAWDWRVSFAVGPSYTFIKNDMTLVRGRVGLGGSQTFGDDDEEFRFEAMAGLDFEHKLTERQKITGMIEYYPNLSDFPDYRLVGQLGYELLVDPESNMFLKIGLADRYDSDPGDGRKKNDFEYFATLSWVF